MPNLIGLPDVLAARDRIHGTAVRTPLIPLDLDRLHEAGFRLGPNAPAIYLKNEAAQPIGSFKLRGAYNKIAALKDRDPAAFARGVITFSSGNHAQGVAYAARALGTRAVIVMPNNAPTIKRQATEALGAEIVTVGPASTERKHKAEDLVRENGYAMIPPYDDPDIIAGQATCGLEIAEQLAKLDASKGFSSRPDAEPSLMSSRPDLTSVSEVERPALPPASYASITTLVLSPVSGGGLLSGTATALKLAAAAANQTPPAVWGCEPELAGDAYESFYAQTLIEWPAAQTTRTLADGLRTQSLGELNFHHLLRFVDGIVTLTEAEIRIATRLLLAATEVVPEPSGAVTLAAALFRADELPKIDRIVAIVSGGNLDPHLRAELEAETTAEALIS